MSQNVQVRTVVRGPRPWDSTMVRLAIIVAILGGATWAVSGAVPAAGESIGAYAPALTRFASSFLVGFLLGWMLRRFLKWTLLIAIVAGGAIFVLRRTGMIDLPWDQIQGELHDGTTWLESQAGSARKVVTGYLPSGFAAAVGVFWGLRH